MFNADRDYAEACTPDVWKILGLKLLPYCEGHKQLLKRIGSPFAVGGLVDAGDLVSALLICSRSYEDGQRFISKRRAIRGVVTILFATIAGIFYPNFIKVRAEALDKYIQESEKLPRGIFRNQFGPDGKPAEKTYAPSALVYESDLCNHFHCTVSEVMNMPMRKATFLRYRLLEFDKLIRWRAPWMGQPQKQSSEASNG